MVNEVQDRKAEIGINLSVVIQGLLLAATVGFGTRIVNSIDMLTVEVGRLTTVTTVNGSEILHNTERININTDNIRRVDDILQLHLKDKLSHVK